MATTILKKFPKGYKHGKIEIFCVEPKQSLNDFKKECPCPHSVFDLYSEFDGKKASTKQLYPYIKAAADLTVKVNAGLYVREYQNDNLRTGTGIITEVEWRTSEDPKSKCDCRNCLGAPRQKNVAGEILVSTAKSLIYNDAEASYSTFRLFYDKVDIPGVRIYGTRTRNFTARANETIVSCYTCDAKLLKLVEEKLKIWTDLKDKPIPNAELTNTFVVAHPHGCPKHICLYPNYGHVCNGIEGAYLLSPRLDTTIFLSDLVQLKLVTNPDLYQLVLIRKKTRWRKRKEVIMDDNLSMKEYDKKYVRKGYALEIKLKDS